jgi:hypothetical protein
MIMSDYGTVRHNLKKAVKQFKEVKDEQLGKGLIRLTRGLEHINKQLRKKKGKG